MKSDIFDHIYAIVTEFDLRIYQQPAGKDIESLKLTGCLWGPSSFATFITSLPGNLTSSD